ICRPQLDVIAEAKQPLESRARAINQCYDNLTITRFVTTLDQCDVAVADVFVNHRVAFDSQRVNSVWPHSSQKEPKPTDSLDVLYRIDGHARGNPSHESHRNCVRWRLVKRHTDRKDVLMVASD